MPFLKPQATASSPPHGAVAPSSRAESPEQGATAVDMGPEQLQKVIARDPVALDRFMDVFGPMLQAIAGKYACRQQGSSWSADDLLHEVIVAIFSDDARMLRSWDADKGRTLRNYLAKFAEYRIQDRLRKRSREEPTAQAELFDHVDRQHQTHPAEEHDAEDPAVARRALERYSAECKPEQRQFAERYFDAASAKALMEEFQLTRNTYDKRVSRMGARLRELAQKLR